MNSNRRMTEEKIQAVPGIPYRPGVEQTGKGHLFTAEVLPGSGAELLLYKEREGKSEVLRIPFLEESRRGNLLSLFVTGLPKREVQYNFCIDGVVKQDPYAQSLVKTPDFGKEEKEEPRSKYREEAFAWTDRGFLSKELSESVFYKVQVRSFTMHRSSKVRKRGTFAGMEEKIPYLQELGITGVLLMPAYEYRERLRLQIKGSPYKELQDEGQGRVNCWGYTGEACYFAPKAAFSASANPVKEFKHLVNALHGAGLECLMEFYFGRELPPSVMLDILRFWKCEYHIDGFHLMGERIPKELFMKDAFLAGSKLFFHDVDGREVFDGKKPFYKGTAEYNEGFLYCMRRLLKGEEGMIEEFMFRSRRNPLCSGVINYMADQDGFSMADMVSYEERHNEANGEENQDGIEYNCTWNCGAEGQTRKHSIRRLRLQQIKNAFALLLFSQGTPLIYQGDEWGNTQKGNNNVWCQDNELGWIDWSGIQGHEKIFTFVKKAIALRKENPVFHMKEEPRGIDYRALGYPDISYHSSQAWYVPKEKGLRCLGMMYCGDYCGQDRKFWFVAVNLHWVSHELALPGMSGEILWQMVLRTDEEENGGFLEQQEMIKERTLVVPPRTIMILTGKQGEKTCGAGNILRRLQGTSF